jgi:hypothetical protein
MNSNIDIDIDIDAEPNPENTISYVKSSFRNYSGIPGLVLIIVLILKNPFVACTNINSQFYNTVLNDFDTSSYFIAFDIKSPTYRGHTIIENNNLYLFLHKTKGFNKERYKSFMKRILIHHKALRIEEKDLYVWKFRKVHDLESVIKIANRGRDNFVAYYFNGKVLNYGLTDKERDAVISQLFYWEFPAKIDKLTGDLILH